MAFNMSVLGGNLKKYRTSRKMTQQELADRLLVSAQSVSKWECGQSIPELDKLCAVAELLNVSLDALLEDTASRDRVLIGVDGGGTKTEFVLFTQDGKLRGRLVLEGTNPNVHGAEHCVATLKKGLHQLLDTGMRPAGIFVGCAGFLSGNYGEQVRDALRETYPTCRIACSSDIMNIIACGSNSQRCIAAICGTGSVVYANVDRVLHRLGGAGYLLDKQGSGFDIGADVLRTALRERDGSGPHSQITELAEARLGGPVWDSIHEIYKRGTSYIASFAPIAFEAYGRQDPVAGEILQNHAGYLAQLIHAAARRYDCGKTVTVSGSIFTANPVFLRLLKERIPAGLEVEVPAYPPVYGACVLACELCGLDTELLRTQFLEQYERISEKGEEVC